MKNKRPGMEARYAQLIQHGKTQIIQNWYHTCTLHVDAGDSKWPIGWFCHCTIIIKYTCIN